MDERKARKVSATILKVGKTKIWISQAEIKRVGEAMTKEDIRALIKEGIIKKRTPNLSSRGRARVLLAKRHKRRKKGLGRRSGSKKARRRDKENWVKNVRAQRETLREMKKAGTEFKKPARQVYLMIKGNYFRGKKYLQAMVKEASK